MNRPSLLREGVAQLVQTNSLALVCISKTKTDRLLLTNAAHRESALTTAPLLYPNASPPGPALTRSVELESRSRANRLVIPWVWFVVKSCAVLANSTHRALGLSKGLEEWLNMLVVPERFTLMSVFVPV